MVATGWAVRPGYSGRDAEDHPAQVLALSWQKISGERVNFSKGKGGVPMELQQSRAGVPAAAGPVLDRRSGGSAEAYEVIVDRNVFGLQPAPPPVVPAVPEPPPNGDLSLTGLCDLNCIRSAFFSVLEAGHVADGFVLSEGEANEWLEVLAVDTASGTAKVRLKKPVVRIRSVGVEVVLSLEKAK